MIDGELRDLQFVTEAFSLEYILPTMSIIDTIMKLPSRNDTAMTLLFEVRNRSLFVASDLIGTKVFSLKSIFPISSTIDTIKKLLGTNDTAMSLFVTVLEK